MSKFQQNDDNDDSDANVTKKNGQRGKRGGVKQKLKEMQAKVRALQAAQGLDYGSYYNDPGYTGPRTGPVPREPPYYDPATVGRAQPYYEDDYYYNVEQPPRVYNHADYDYPRPPSSASSIAPSRTPGYPAGYPAPSMKPPPSRPPQKQPYSSYPGGDLDVGWGSSVPQPKKAATGGNTIPLGPPRGGAPGSYLVFIFMFIKLFSF